MRKFEFGISIFGTGMVWILPTRGILHLALVLTLVYWYTGIGILVFAYWYIGILVLMYLYIGISVLVYCYWYIGIGILVLAFLYLASALLDSSMPAKFFNLAFLCLAKALFESAREIQNAEYKQMTV